ncbi:MAG: response regulator [Acidimicrobiales bacterium]|nr:response regulator [Acidimicrobiales bacterium]
MTSGGRVHDLVNAGLARPAHILLVEDSPSDVAMTIAALRECRVANDLFVVGDGEAAMAYLRKEGEYEAATVPDLILLDLNLPRKDGREVLQEVKADPVLGSIPVIVLTTSAAETDIVRSYALHASGYVTKPVGFDAFQAAIRGIEEFWLLLVRLPSTD